MNDLHHKFVKRKEVWVPTFRGWLVLFTLVAILFSVITTSLFPFLAVNRAVQADLLVVEGWLPQYALKKAIEEFKKQPYRILVTTGAPIERGFLISKFKTYAEFGAETLKQLGLEEESIISIPTPPVKKDRTYASALAVKNWLRTADFSPKGVNIYSFSLHARRSWILFKKAFGDELNIGVLNAESQDYNSNNWWKTSIGMRAVINEALAYCYVRFFFYPKDDISKDAN